MSRSRPRQCLLAETTRPSAASGPYDTDGKRVAALHEDRRGTPALGEVAHNQQFISAAGLDGGMDARRKTPLVPFEHSKTMAYEKFPVGVVDNGNGHDIVIPASAEVSVDLDPSVRSNHVRSHAAKGKHRLRTRGAGLGRTEFTPAVRSAPRLTRARVIVPEHFSPPVGPACRCSGRRRRLPFLSDCSLQAQAAQNCDDASAK